MKRLLGRKMARTLPECTQRPIRKFFDLYRSVVEWSYLSGLRSTEGLSLPDFMGIGAQKAGTRWLHENLCAHPELYLATPKELHFFNWYLYRGFNYYSRKFEPGRGMLKGEVTPAYSQLPLSRIRFIREFMPDVKFILILRNPVDRAWSNAQMSIVRHTGRSSEDVGEAEFVAHFNSSHSTRRGDYPTILDNWLSVFPREQIFIGFFEDLSERPKELLGDIFEFLGVSRDVDWELFPYGRVFAKGSKHTPMPDKFREYLQDMYRRDIELLYERFGEPVKGWRC
ncbi:MAG: sulfotransferase domain-containing protein [Thermodesulfobacteriota bacterium]